MSRLKGVTVKRCRLKGVRNLFPERPFGCFAQKVPDTFSDISDLLSGQDDPLDIVVDLPNISQLAPRGKCSSGSVSLNSS